MVHEISTHSNYITGAARFSYLVYLVIQDKALTERSVDHCRLIAFQRGELAHIADRNWNTTAICVVKKPSEKMVAISEYGDVLTYVKGVTTEELIQPRPTVVRNVGVVDGIALACGMRREVFMRVREAEWIAIPAPVPAPQENAGFEAICGFSMAEVYAVGWDGEIWQWNGEKWVERPSPTNLILTGICCGEDGRVYVCGQGGTLIRGRNETWEIISTADAMTDFWDLCWFNGALYIASMTMLFRLIDDRLEAVDFGSDPPRTCGRLSSAQGVLWSVGASDVFSYDGATWTRVD